MMNIEYNDKIIFSLFIFSSGAFLEDAMVLSCGHSFGGLMLKKVLEMVYSDTSFFLRV
jgi:hypothetical protein